MRQALIAASIILGLLLAGPVLSGPGAAAAQSAEEDPAELAREGMERMLRALTLLIEMIPIYEMPEVMENGDIIIRRKNPLRDVDEEEDEVEETKT